MARRYDSRTTIFSPEGRLYQVEYAREAISHAGTALGILCDDGVVLAAERTSTSKLLEQSATSEKIYEITSAIACAVAGFTPDADTLVENARIRAQQWLLTYNEDIPAEILVQHLCDHKQGYTQYGGLRPFGVSFLFAGHDDHHGFQLYHSDPSGNYSGWKATCIGAHSSNAQSILKQDYKEGLTLKEAKDLTMKVLAKTMDSNNLTSDKLEFATLHRNKVTGHIEFHLYKPSEIDELLKDVAPPAEGATAASASAST